MIPMALPNNTILPQIPSVHPPALFLCKCIQQTVFSPAVLEDSVELEAKGQASAQITTGTIIRSQKIREKKIVLVCCRD